MPTLHTPPADLRNPARLQQHLRDVHSDMLELSAAIDDARTQIANPPERPVTAQQLAQIRSALSAGGSAPIDLTGMTGASSTPQLPAPVAAKDLATLNAKFPASSYAIGTMAITSTPGHVYRAEAGPGGAHVWTQYL